MDEKASIIKQHLDTVKGRAALSAAMVEPIRRRLYERSLMRGLLFKERLLPSHLPPEMEDRPIPCKVPDEST